MQESSFTPDPFKFIRNKVKETQSLLSKETNPNVDKVLKSIDAMRMSMNDDLFARTEFIQSQASIKQNEERYRELEQRIPLLEQEIQDNSKTRPLKGKGDLVDDLVGIMDDKRAELEVLKKERDRILKPYVETADAIIKDKFEKYVDSYKEKHIGDIPNTTIFDRVVKDISGTDDISFEQYKRDTHYNEMVDAINLMKSGEQLNWGSRSLQYLLEGFTGLNLDKQANIIENLSNSSDKLENEFAGVLARDYQRKIENTDWSENAYRSILGTIGALPTFIWGLGKYPMLGLGREGFKGFSKEWISSLANAPFRTGIVRNPMRTLDYMSKSESVRDVMMAPLKAYWEEAAETIGEVSSPMVGKFFPGISTAVNKSLGKLGVKLQNITDKFVVMPMTEMFEDEVTNLVNNDPSVFTGDFNTKRLLLSAITSSIVGLGFGSNAMLMKNQYINQLAAKYPELNKEELWSMPEEQLDEVAMKMQFPKLQDSQKLFEQSVNKGLSLLSDEDKQQFRDGYIQSHKEFNIDVQEEVSNSIDELKSEDTIDDNKRTPISEEFILNRLINYGLVNPIKNKVKNKPNTYWISKGSRKEWSKYDGTLSINTDDLDYNKREVEKRLKRFQERMGTTANIYKIDEVHNKEGKLAGYTITFNQDEIDAYNNRTKSEDIINPTGKGNIEERFINPPQSSEELLSAMPQDKTELFEVHRSLQSDLQNAGLLKDIKVNILKGSSQNPNLSNEQKSEDISAILQGTNIKQGFNNARIFPVTSEFNKFIDNQQGAIDITQFRPKSKIGQSIIDKFVKEFLNGRTKIPKDRVEQFKQDWNNWLKENFGLRHKEGMYRDKYGMGGYDRMELPYGLENITNNHVKDLSGSEVVISGDYLFKDMPHTYEIFDQETHTQIDAAGLGWYIYTEINGVPFIYEWQSDILPDIFGKSVSSTVKENPNKFYTNLSKYKERFELSNLSYYQDSKGNYYKSLLRQHSYAVWKSRLFGEDMSALTNISKQEYENAKSQIKMPYEKEVLTSGEVRISDENGTKYYNQDIYNFDTGKVSTKFKIGGDSYERGIYNEEPAIYKMDDNGNYFYETSELDEDGMKLLIKASEITKSQFEEARKKLEKNSISSSLGNFTNPAMSADDFERAMDLQFDEYYRTGIKPTESLSEQRHRLNKSNESSLAYLEQLYKKYWNIWLMHSFMYAKEKGHNEVYLPTAIAMLDIEDSERTAAMYTTKYDISSGDFSKVGPYWTALSKIKGIELKLEQPEWSSVPLIKADISNVDTSTYTLFSKDEKLTFGSYNSIDKVMSLYTDAINKDSSPEFRLLKTTSHELVHHATVGLIDKSDGFRNDLQKLVDIYKEKGHESPHYSRIFGQENSDKIMKEFIAEIFSNENMQIETNSITDESFGNKKVSLFRRFVDSVSKWLGNLLGRNLNENGLLYQTISLTDEYLSQSTQLDAIAKEVGNQIKQENINNMQSLIEGMNITSDDVLSSVPAIDTDKLSVSDKLAMQDEIDDDSIDAMDSWTTGMLINKHLVDNQGIRLFNSIYEALEFVQSNSLEDFTEIVKTSANYEQLDKEYQDKYFIGYANYTYGLLKSRKRYTVAQISLPGDKVAVQTTNRTYYDTKDKLKTTVMRNQLFEKIQRQITESTGVEFQMLPIVTSTKSWWNMDKNKWDVYSKDSRLTKISNNTIIKLYEQGYLLLPNKNTQFLIPLSSLKNFQLSGDALADVVNFWKFFLDNTLLTEPDTWKQLKRTNNMLGEGSKAFLYPEVKEHIGENNGRWRVNEEDNTIMINSAVLSLDYDTLPSNVKSYIDSLDAKGDILGDGAVFELDETHDLVHFLNGVPVSKIGDAYKTKVSEQGLLIKSANFKISKHGLIGRFMVRNKIERLVIKTALKIGLSGKYQGKDVLTWDDIKGNPNVPLDKDFIIEHNIMDDAFLYAKGKVKSTASGTLGSLITNSWTYLVKGFKDTILDKWNKDSTQLKEFINSLTKEDKIKMVDTFLENNPNLEDFQSARMIRGMISNGTLHEFNPTFSDFFIKNIMSRYITNAMRHNMDGTVPVIRPDLGELTGYEGMVKSQLKRTGISDDEIKSKIEQWFDNGFIRDGYIILGSAVARELKSKQGEKLIGTVNPPGFFIDTKVLTNIGIIGIEKGKFNGKEFNHNSNTVIPSNKDFVVNSGKDFDIDTIILFKSTPIMEKLAELEQGKMKEALDAFDKRIITKPIVTDFKDNVAQKLGMKKMPNFMYKLAQMYGINWSNVTNLKLDEKGLSYIANLLNGDGIFNIGQLYNIKMQYQAALESAKDEKLTLPGIGVIRRKRKDVEVNTLTTKLDNDKVLSNLALLKHLTDLTIDWLSDQRILKLNISKEKVLSTVFGVPESDAENLGSLLWHYLGDIRNTFKDASSVFGHDEFEGYNKVSDIINDARIKVKLENNPFKDSLIFQSVKDFIEKFDSSSKMSLDNEQYRHVNNRIFNEIGTKTKERPDFEFLYYFAKLGSEPRLDKSHLTDGKYLNKSDNGLAAFAWSVDNWNKVVRNNPNNIKLINFNPFLRLFKEIFSNNVWVQLRNKTFASFKASGFNKEPALINLSKTWHIIYIDNGEMRFKCEVRRDDNRTVDKTLIDTNLFSQYIYKLQNEVPPEYRFNDYLLRRLFTQPNISNWFELISLGTQANREILTNITKDFIQVYTEKMSDYEKRVVFKSMLGLIKKGSEQGEYGLTMIERSSTISDDGKPVLMISPNIGVNMLNEINDPVGNNVLNEYFSTLNNAITGVMGSTATKEEYQSTESMNDKEPDNDKEPINPRRYWMTYPAVLRSDARENGYIVPDEEFDNPVGYFMAGTNERHSITPRFIYNTMNMVKGNRMSNNMIDWTINYGIQNEFTQAQIDLDKIHTSIYKSLSQSISNNTVSLSTDKGLVDYANRLVSDIAENRGYEYMNRMSIGKDGKVYFNGKSYQIFENKETRKITRKFNKLVNDGKLLYQLATDILGEDNLFKENTVQSKDMSIRIMASAIINRYVFDWYVPSMLNDFSGMLTDYSSTVIPNLTGNNKIEVMSVWKDIAERTSEMIRQIEGMKEQLLKRGMRYIPNMIQEERLVDLWTDIYVKDGMKEKDARKKAIKEVIRDSRNTGEPIIIDVNFIKRNDVPIGKEYMIRDNMQLVQGYLRALNTYMRKQTFRLYQLSNESYLKDESLSIRKERLRVNAVISNNQFYFHPIQFSDIKENDWISYTKDGKRFLGKVSTVSPSVITMNGEKYSKFEIANIRVQRGNGFLNKLKGSDSDIISKVGTTIENVGHEYIQNMSRLLLGMENIRFGFRNIISGVIQRRIQVGKVSTSIKSALNDYYKILEGGNISDAQQESLYKMIAEYSGAIRGGVDDFYGRFAGVVDSLRNELSPEMLSFISDMKQESSLENDKNQKLLDELKNIAPNTKANLDEYDKFKRRIDNTYQKWSLYSFPLGLLAKTDAGNLFLGRLLNPVEGEAFLRDTTAVLAVLKAQEDWKWDERKDNPQFVDFFNKKVVPGEILKAVRNAQVSYTALDRALADDSIVGKILMTQFGHFSITQQANFIQAWRNMFKQAEKYGWSKVFSNRITDIAKVNGDEYDYNVRSEFKKVIGQIGFAGLSELVGAMTYVAGKSAISLVFGGILDPMVNLIADNIYLKTIGKNTPIPMLSMGLRLAMIGLSMAIKTGADDDDSKWLKYAKAVGRNMGQSPSEYIKYNQNKKGQERLSGSLGKSLLQRSYWEEFGFEIGSSIPGLGANEFARGISELIGSLVYGGTMNEYLFNAGMARLPFNRLLRGINQTAGYPIPVYFGMNKLHTFKNKKRAKVEGRELLEF